MSFADLKRKSQSNFEFLQKELDKSSTSNGADDRLWKPELDVSGNGYAVIRFLPAPDGETVPWAKLYTHAFKGPGGWLIDNCPTTLGDKCPVCAENTKLWSSGHESDKTTARDRKRKLSYYSNIYVITDPKNPSNEGKAFLFKYGKKIHDKILAAMQPEFQDETPVNIFDFWEGANFKIKIKTIGGYWNYDASEFISPAALSSDDDKMETLWKNSYSLETFTSPEMFKSYNDLQTRMDSALSGLPATRQTEHEEYETPAEVTPSTRKYESSSSSSVSHDNDDALSYFAALANDD